MLKKLSKVKLQCSSSDGTIDVAQFMKRREIQSQLRAEPSFAKMRFRSNDLWQLRVHANSLILDNRSGA